MESDADIYEEGQKDVIRLSGTDRYDTGYKVADALKVELGVDKFDTVIVATGKAFADALSGSYLAAKQNAPILLTNGKEKNVEKLCEYIAANLNADGMISIRDGLPGWIMWRPTCSSNECASALNKRW